MSFMKALNSECVVHVRSALRQEYLNFLLKERESERMKVEQMRLYFLSSHEERQSQDGAYDRRHLSRRRLWGPLPVAWKDKIDVPRPLAMIIESAAISMYFVPSEYVLRAMAIPRCISIHQIPS